MSNVNLPGFDHFDRPAPSAAGLNLNLYSGQVGGAWQRTSGTLVHSTTGGIRGNGAGNNYFYILSGSTPTSTNFEIRWRYSCKTNLNDFPHVIAYADAAGGTARYSAGKYNNGQFRIYRYGVADNSGTALQITNVTWTDNTEYDMRLVFARDGSNNNTITAYRDGVQIGTTYTDTSSITTLSPCGVSSFGTQTDTTGTHITQFAVKLVSGGNTRKQVICIGDSNTEGYGTTNPATDGWPGQLATLLGTSFDVLNAGVSGRPVYKASYTLPEGIYQVTSAQASAVAYDSNRSRNIAVLAGYTNDLRYDWATIDVDPSILYNRVVAMVQILQAQGYRVFVSTMLPNTNTTTYQATFNTTRNAVNVLLRNGALANTYTVIDVAADPDIGPDSAPDSTANYNPDKIHLNINGHGKYAALVAAAVNAADPPITDAPATLTATLASGVMKLTFSPVANATSYQITRIVAGVSTIVTSDQTALTFLDSGYTGPVPDAYTVAGFNGLGAGPAKRVSLGGLVVRREQ